MHETLLLFCFVKMENYSDKEDNGNQSMFPNDFLQDEAATKQLGVCTTVKAENVMCHVTAGLECSNNLL